MLWLKFNVHFQEGSDLELDQDADDEDEVILKDTGNTIWSSVFTQTNLGRQCRPRSDCSFIFWMHLLCGKKTLSKF